MGGALRKAGINAVEHLGNPMTIRPVPQRKWRKYLPLALVLLISLALSVAASASCALSGGTQQVPDFPEYVDGTNHIERQKRIKARQREQRERRRQIAMAYRYKAAARDLQDWQEIGIRAPYEWEPQQDRLY